MNVRISFRVFGVRLSFGLGVLWKLIALALGSGGIAWLASRLGWIGI